MSQRWAHPVWLSALPDCGETAALCRNARRRLPPSSVDLDNFHSFFNCSKVFVHMRFRTSHRNPKTSYFCTISTHCFVHTRSSRCSGVFGLCISRSAPISSKLYFAVLYPHLLEWIKHTLALSTHKVGTVVPWCYTKSSRLGYHHEQ